MIKRVKKTSAEKKGRKQNGNIKQKVGSSQSVMRNKPTSTTSAKNDTKRVIILAELTVPEHFREDYVRIMDLTINRSVADNKIKADFFTARSYNELIELVKLYKGNAVVISNYPPNYAVAASGKVPVEAARESYGISNYFFSKI